MVWSRGELGEWAEMIQAKPSVHRSGLFHRSFRSWLELTTKGLQADVHGPSLVCSTRSEGKLSLG
jgi:hypothetical protein